MCSALLWSLALLLSRLPTTAFAAECAAPPIVLPYQATSIVPGRLVQGISITIGDPPQRVALTPSLMLDHTFIPRYTNSCVRVSDMALPSPQNTTARTQNLRRSDGHPGDFEEDAGEGRYWQGEDWWIKCAEIYGGGYEPELSTSYSINTTYDAEETLFKARNYTNWTYVDDMIAFDGSLEAYVEHMDKAPANKDLKTTVTLPNNGTLSGGLGSSPLSLTPDSTLLEALHSAAMVPSTSWTLTNETLCLGCTDSRANKSAFQIFKPADRKADEKLPCLIQATVEALNWHPKEDVESVSLIKESFKTCIDPGVKFLVLPDDARKAFVQATDRAALAEYDDYTVLSGPTREDVGILEFKLEGGLDVNVTIPGSGQVGAEEKGEWRIPFGKGGWGSYGSGIWVLGKPFTDQIVLRWNSVTKDFGIAIVNLDPAKVPDLEPLGCDNFPAKDVDGSTGFAMGTIVGAALGGFFGGLLFAVAGIFFFRRGTRGIKRKYQPMLDEDAITLTSVTADPRTLESTSGGNSAPSIRESVHSQGARSVSPMMEPQLVADSSIYEAPEGGTAYPTKRVRQELGIPIGYHR